jgi:outer membrane lipase/esterase
MGVVATTAATNVANQVGQLAAGGARTIIVMNLPDLGGAPQFNTSAAAPLASFTTNQYNTVLSGNLAAVAAANPNARILQVNIASLFSMVQANPAAFGFTNVTQQCLTTVACVTGTTAQRNQYLFWDGVHPTAAAHQIIAQAAAAYLSAGDRALAAAAITEIAVADRRSGAYRALDRLGDYKPVAGKTDIYVSVIGDYADVASRGAAPAYNYGAGGLEVGVLRHISRDVTLGGAFSAKTGAAKSSSFGNKVEMDPTSFTLDMVARWNGGSGLFVQGALGASITRITDFERTMYIGNLVNRGETVSTAYSAVSQVGYAMGMGNMTITPSVKLGYLSGNTRSFRESGAIAPLAYAGRMVGTFVAAGELKAQFAISQTASAHAMVGYEAYFGQTGTNLRGSIADSPGSTFNRTVGKIESPGFLFGVGLTGQIASFQTTAEYRGAISGDGKLQHRGTISGRVGF